MHARNIRQSLARPVARGAALLSLAAVVGCAAAASQPSPVDTSARALVYGHIEASKPIEAVRLAKMLSARHPWATVLPNGDFFFEDVAPGTEDSPTRSLPFASIDAGLVFERQSGSVVGEGWPFVMP